MSLGFRSRAARGSGPPPCFASSARPCGSRNGSSRSPTCPTKPERSVRCSAITWTTSPSRCTLPRHPIMRADRTSRRCRSNRDGQMMRFAMSVSSSSVMTANGYPSEFAERTFKQLEGFGSYGFPESHAASFALIAYASSWMKCHHPDVFLAAILNAQPMGFYAPAQLVRDAERHGVEVRPPDINHSRWDCTLEPADGGRFAVRLGLRMVRGLANRDGALIVAARGHLPFGSVQELWRRAGVPVAALERLAEADAFGSLGLSRRQALWDVRALGGEPLPLFAEADRQHGLLQPELEE